MDKPIYVKITNANSSQYWYANRIGQIFPVLEERDTNYSIIKATNYNAGYCIEKSDCEVVPTLQPENSYKKVIEQCQDVLAGYLLPDSTLTRDIVIDRLLGILDNQELVRQMRGVVPEGQHLISTEQLKSLFNMGEKLYATPIVEKLKDWFPTVFVPAKTYKPGQTVQTETGAYLLAGSGAKLIAINKAGFIESEMFVKDLQKVEESDLKALLSPNTSFTLLPDTTDQMV